MCIMTRRGLNRTVVCIDVSLKASMGFVIPGTTRSTAGASLRISLHYGKHLLYRVLGRLTFWRATEQRVGTDTRPLGRRGGRASTSARLKCLSLDSRSLEPENGSSMEPFLSTCARTASFTANRRLLATSSHSEEPCQGIQHFSATCARTSESCLTSSTAAPASGIHANGSENSFGRAPLLRAVIASSGSPGTRLVRL